MPRTITITDEQAGILEDLLRNECEAVEEVGGASEDEDATLTDYGHQLVEIAQLINADQGAKLRRAREIYRGDWDADGAVSTGFPRKIAHAVLEARGWSKSESARGYIKWVAPDGEVYWETDSALQNAITAEAA